MSAVPSSFTRKRLRFTFTLSQGGFGPDETQLSTLTIQGLRATVEIQKGGVMMSTLNAKVYGMRAADMNQLTMLGWRAMSIAPNTVIIEAGDDTSGLSEIFRGQILNCWADYSAQPDVFLNLEAQTAYFEQIAPVAPRSYTGPTDVATAMADIAARMGFSFENNGVNVQLASPYLPGAALLQAQRLAAAAGVDMLIDNGVLAIMPKGVSRPTPTVPVIDSASGLVGYPVQDKMGLTFRCIYTPLIRLSGLVQVIPPGKTKAQQYYVYGLNYVLQSETPGGEWFTHVKCSEQPHGPG